MPDLYISCSLAGISCLTREDRVLIVHFCLFDFLKSAELDSSIVLYVKDRYGDIENSVTRVLFVTLVSCLTCGDELGILYILFFF